MSWKLKEKAVKLQSSYLNRQKMQSLHELMQQVSMESARERLGMEPMHFVPKVQVDEVFIQDNLEFGERPASYHELPKFASTKIHTQSSATRSQFEASRLILLNISQRINENLTIYPLRTKNGSLSSLIVFLIWIAYVIGTSQSSLQINLFNLIDFTGMGIAFAITIYEIIISKKPIQFDHFLHTLAIVTTIVLALYSSDAGDSFPFVLRIIRSFRLFFIMNINFCFEDLCQMYFHKSFRILKVLQPWIFITLLFSVIMYQGTYYQFYNRCGTLIQNSILPNFSQTTLCGSKTCQGASLCTNPLSYDRTPDSSLYNNGSQLAFGYFQYDNLLHSYFTIISSAFLANASKIIAIFMNSSPILIVVIVNILLIAASKLLGSSILLVLLQEYFCEKQSRINMLGEQLTSKIRVSNISGNSFAAPTFGPNSAKSIDLKFKKNSKDQSFELNKNEEEGGDQNTLDPHRSIKVVNTKQYKSEKDIGHDNQETCYNKTVQMVTIVFVILVGSAHFGLSIIFSFGKLNEMDNRLIGVCLIVIFIVWTVWIFLKMSGITEQGEEKKNQEVEENNKVIFSIEIAIYLMHFADYVTRIFMGMYLVQQSSPLTPLATSLLLVRILYIPIAFQSILFSSNGWEKLIISIKVYQELACNILVFFMFVMTCSLILATFTKQINGLGFFYQAWKYCKTIFNLNWLEHYNHSKINHSIDASDGWGVVIKTILILIGQLIILNIIFADAIINAFHTYMHIKEINTSKVAEEAMDKQAIKQLIRKQKTFYLIPYDFLCIRSTIDSLLETEKYKGGKQKILSIYMIALPIGYCFLKDSMGYEYFMLIGDVLLLLDACLTIIAHRFWGGGSLVNKKWYNLVNFLISVITIVNFAMPLFDLFFLRTLRMFLMIGICAQLGESYQKICSCLASMGKIFKLILFVWMILALMVAIMMAKVSNSDTLTMIIESFNLSLRLMEKGFDLPSALGFNIGNQPLFYTIYNTLIYLFARIPLQCVLIGVGIAHFQNQNFQKQDDQMIQLAIQTQFDNNGLNAEQNYELHSIKSKILSYFPEFNPINGLESNFVKDVFDQYSHLLTAFKVILIIIDAFLLIFIPLITHYITEQQLLQVKLIRFAFYLLSLLFFILDSAIYKACNDHFYVKLMIYVISFPGSLLMMVPIHKVQASPDLASLLQFFVMLAPLTILQVYYVIQFKIIRIVQYITAKFRYTLWILLWMLSATIFLTGITLLIINQPFIYLISMVFVGMCGATYEIVLEKNQNNSIIALHMVEICIFFAGLVLRSVLIASFIFQCAQKIGDFKRDKGLNKEILRSDFNKIFNQEFFLDLWNKLDTKAIGMLPFRTVLNNLYKFAKCFNLHELYIEYVLRPKHEAFQLKMQLFRRLHLPIRIVSVTQRADDSRGSEYMITMYDLIAKFYCLALDDNIHKIQPIQGIQEIKQLNHTHRNWSSKLGFDGEQWAKSVSEKLNTVNYKRWMEEQQQEKYFVPKDIQINSWSMGSVLRVFPALRTRLSSIKLKAK